MTPMVTIQVDALRSRFDGTVQVLHDFDDTAVVLLTPRGSAPLCTAEDLMDYLAQHPQTVLPLWDSIDAERRPFVLALNHISFKTLDCAVPPLRAVE
ncbi:hypothetical protein [Reyranella sp.]|uniref:hypothetical protein n=1 Tax=Reyranella sp. TaxID=1929291 RepID=UPI003D1506D6